MQTEQKKYKNIEKTIAENKNIIDTKAKALDSMKASVDQIQGEYAQAETLFKRAQQEYEALCCGFVVVDEESAQLQTIQDQFLSVKSKLSEHATFIKKAKMMLENSLKENDKIERELQTDTKNYEEMERRFAAETEQNQRLLGQLEALDYDPAKWDAMSQQKRSLNAQISSLSERCQTFYSRFPLLNLEYRNPEANFDRKRVKGIVSNLFRLKDEKFSQALETCAGGKLYNLVVDTDQTRKLILEHGELKRKVTIIPMNEIRGFVISDDVIRIAKSLVGHDQVFHALSLIDYPPEYRQVMEYVFGSKFICYDLNTAKQIKSLLCLLG
jgi:structural maintenance of chromosome 2